MNWMGESAGMPGYTLERSAAWLDCARPAWVKAADGRFLDANDAFGNLFGTSPRRLVGRLDSALFVKREVRKFRIDDGIVLGTGRAWVFLEPPDSIDDVWCATVKFPLRRGSGHTPAVGAMSFPVTDWLRLEKKLGAGAHELPSPSAWFGETWALIAAGFRGPLRVRDLARRLGMNRDYVGRAFAEHAGLTVSQYVRARRVAWAAERLRNSGSSIAAVALLAGYADQSHMTREFRTFTGRTPLEVRRTDRTAQDTQEPLAWLFGSSAEVFDSCRLIP